MHGTLVPGQLVAFFGYATFLTTPLRTAIEYVIATTRAYVGAGRVLRILNVEPLVVEPASPLLWPATIDTLEDRVVACRFAGANWSPSSPRRRLRRPCCATDSDDSWPTSTA